MQMSHKILTAVAAAAALSGCAMTTTQLPLNYHPTPGFVKPVKTSNSIAVKPFEDARGEDPRIIMHKINGYQEETTGAYVAEKPIVEILQSAVEESLESSGYKVTQDHARFSLYGKFVSFEAKPLIGMFSSTLQTKLTLNLKLRDGKADNICWTDTITGKSSVQSSMGTSEEDWLRKGFKLAADNAISHLLNDEDFQHALSR